MNYPRRFFQLLTATLILATTITASLAFSPEITKQLTPGVQAQSGSNPTYLPLVTNNTYAATGPGEWTQYAHDAQRTGYTSQVVSTPWRWKWAWNGPTSTGGVVSGKIRLPRQSQPVTGGGRVYIAAGARGVYALSVINGSQVWNQNPGGEVNSTPAYDPSSDSLFVVSSNGHLYRLNGSTGQTNGDFNAQATSTLPLPPAIVNDRVFFSMGNKVFAIQANTMTQLWAYDAGSPVQTPPAFSPSTGLVVALSEDLYVHAIRNMNGTRAWRVKPTSLAPGDPGDSNPMAEVKYGWPVIAEVHGLVLVRYRLNWQTLWTWNPWPTSNAQMRSNLAARPDQVSIYALRLSDGGVAFNNNVGNGGFGDGGRLNMGSMPVIKRFDDGTEAAYVVMRGAACINTPCDGRYDSHFGEMPLDSSTVPGFQAGDVRFMQNTFFPTDEQVFLSMSGNYIFGGHWMFGIAHQVLDRSASKGASSGNPITTGNLPHIINSSTYCSFSASHYCSRGLLQDGDQRYLPPGFYIYYNQPGVYNQYWSSYAAWVVSGTSIYFVSTDGAVVALENGPTLAEAAAPQAVPEAAPEAPILADPIPYTQAREAAGAIATVEGEVKFMFNNGKAVLLGFENPHEGAFKAMVEKADWPNFSAQPDQLFGPGQTVRVHGLIEWYQGDPVIYVREPGQIEVLASGPSGSLYRQARYAAQLAWAGAGLR